MFSHERLLNFVKCFFRIYWESHMNFVLYVINMAYYEKWFSDRRFITLLYYLSGLPLSENSFQWNGVEITSACRLFCIELKFFVFSLLENEPMKMIASQYMSQGRNTILILMASGLFHSVGLIIYCCHCYDYFSHIYVDPDLSGAGSVANCTNLLVSSFKKNDDPGFLLPEDVDLLCK